MIILNLFFTLILGEELYDFRPCYQEKIAINILAQLPENLTRADAILWFLEDLELIRNTYGNMQPIRFSLLDLLRGRRVSVKDAFQQKSKWNQNYDKPLFANGKPNIENEYTSIFRPLNLSTWTNTFAFDQGFKFALRIRFIAKNSESEANSLRFAEKL